MAALQYLELWRRVRDTPLSSAPDAIHWRWTASGVYSAKSCYDAFFLGSTTAPHAQLIWKTWAPLCYKVFIWLVTLDRCWTAERLARHGLPHEDSCAFCDQALESMHHLLAACPFSRQVWHDCF